jgi:hypothetical protein
MNSNRMPKPSSTIFQLDWSILSRFGAFNAMLSAIKQVGELSKAMRDLGQA